MIVHGGQYDSVDLATSNILVTVPVATGRSIVLSAFFHGTINSQNVWRVDFDASNLERLSEGKAEGDGGYRDLLMKSWRMAVIALLRTTLQAGQLQTELTVDQMEDLLTHLEKCWWSIKIQSFEDKGHFLQYAGRYVRRPPIAQRRITWIGERTVRFWYKDKKLRRRVEVQCSLEEFIDRWSQHIPERYQHAVRSFGLFAPRSLGQTCAAIFAILRQERRPRPKPRPYAASVKRAFGHDPLLDHTGKRMKWVRRLAPKASR